MKSVARKKYPRVAIWANKHRSYARGVLRGIAEYAETYGPWSMFVDSPSGNFFNWLKDWRGDGILAYVGFGDDCSDFDFKACHLPTVDLAANNPGLKIPQVGNDNLAIGRLAAEHLLERQFKHFAFCGYHDERWSLLRQQGLTERVGGKGYTVDVFYSPWPRNLGEWEQRQIEMARWVATLPKPCGILACSDHRGQRVLDACARAECDVPEEVAVIGVDNDEETCRFCEPPLTSVIDNTRKIGFEAARLLDLVMHRKINAKEIQPILVPPIGVATRRSTDITAIDDKLVANATRYIREHACDGISVVQLPKIFGVSRSVFYRRFQIALGRSPHQEIIRVQLDRVKSLLSQTKLSVEDIAAMTGFKHPEYLSVAFKREVGKTPGEFRRVAAEKA